MLWTTYLCIDVTCDSLCSLGLCPSFSPPCPRFIFSLCKPYLGWGRHFKRAYRRVGRYSQDILYFKERYLQRLMSTGKIFRGRKFPSISVNCLRNSTPTFNTLMSSSPISQHNSNPYPTGGRSVWWIAAYQVLPSSIRVPSTQHAIICAWQTCFQFRFPLSLPQLSLTLNHWIALTRLSMLYLFTSQTTVDSVLSSYPQYPLSLGSPDVIIPNPIF